MLCKSRDERRFPFVFQLKALSKVPAGIDAWTIQYVAIAIVPGCVGKTQLDGNAVNQDLRAATVE